MTDPPTSASASEPLVAVTRGGWIESIHRGSIAVADSGGRVLASCGDPFLPVFTRSAAKPFQALALFDTGAVERFAIPEDELAIVIASHGAEELHLRLVRSLMERTGVSPEWLQCGAHPPLDPVARDRLRQQGAPPTVLHNNCSGKHTGMLACCLAASEECADYLHPGHPVQRRILELVSRATGVAASEIDVAIDGCSAPNYRLPLKGLAVAGARLAEAGLEGRIERVSGLRAVWRAMLNHPEVIAGTHGRLDTDLMRAASSIQAALAAKSGAEGTYLVAIQGADGPIGMAVKIEDGGERGRNCAVVETLLQLGFLPREAADALRPYHRPTLRNHAGAVVGEIHPLFALRHMPSDPPSGVQSPQEAQ